MKKFIIFGTIIIGLSFYFFLGLVIFPQEFLTHEIIKPKPIQYVTFSNEEITLGESFEIEIEVENKNDFADILITSIAFPNLQEIDDTVKISSYDFTQSPRNIALGNKINSKYTSGGQITAKYPSIEAYSRNVKENSTFHMAVIVTPKNSGSFETFIKTIAIPHTTEFSHYPYDGILDYQSEYVSVYTVNVNP